MTRKHESKAFSRFLGFIHALLLVMSLASTAHAGATIDSIKNRGKLRCGVSEGIPGFSVADADGHWAGLDVDFCRAVAAALLSDPQKVEFVPLRASARFPALKSGVIDLLARNTTWTLLREAGLGLRFPGVLFYDGQGFMASSESGITSVADLSGETLCIEKGTNHEANLREYFAAHNLSFTPLVLDSAPETAAAFFAGRCRAYSSDTSQLAAMRLQAPAGYPPPTILAEQISKEPLSPVIRNDDPEWITAVRWVLFSLIEAEERGITRSNAEHRLKALKRSLLNTSEDGNRILGVVLGFPEGWGYRVLQAVGNYGEMYDRNLGPSTPLGLDRGPNRLWNQGGLMYAPPLR